MVTKKLRFSIIILLNQDNYLHVYRAAKQNDLVPKNCLCINDNFGYWYECLYWHRSSEIRCSNYVTLDGYVEESDTLIWLYGSQTVQLIYYFWMCQIWVLFLLLCQFRCACSSVGKFSCFRYFIMTCDCSLNAWEGDCLKVSSYFRENNFGVTSRPWSGNFYFFRIVFFWIRYRETVLS
jgi:hypothetical protein